MSNPEPESIWQLIESSPPPRDEYVLVFRRGYPPTVAKTTSDRVLFCSWELSQVGSYAADSEPNFEPTHWAPIPETPQ